MSRTPHPATLILMGKGITIAELAEALKMTPQAISYQLTGQSRTTNPDLLQAIEVRSNYTTRLKVAAAIRAGDGDRFGPTAADGMAGQRLVVDDGRVHGNSIRWAAVVTHAEVLEGGGAISLRVMIEAQL